MPEEVAVWNDLFLGLFGFIVKELEQKSTMNYAGVRVNRPQNGIARENRNFCCPDLPDDRLVLLKMLLSPEFCRFSFVR